MTAMSGLAQKFWHLLFCRVGVGVGEATLSPAAYSLIADYFPPQRRATAIGVYSFGIYLGTGLSLVCLGLLMGFVGGASLSCCRWSAQYDRGRQYSLSLDCQASCVPRYCILCRGAAARRFEVARSGERRADATGGSVCDPGGTSGHVLESVPRNGLPHVCRIRQQHVGDPTLCRQARLDGHPGRRGVGIIIAFCGGAGAVGGGRVADVLRSRGRADANLRVALLGAAVMAVASVRYPLANSARGRRRGGAVVVGFSAPFGVVVAAIQQLVPGPNARQATALFLFVINLLGMALGPSSSVG